MWSTSNSSSDEEDEETHTIKVLVESQYVGHIVGRGRQNLERIQRWTDTRIVVHGGPPTYPTDTTISIVGTESSIRQAVSRIAVIIHKFSPTTVTFKLLVPDSRCGLIIGRGGSTIRSIRSSADSTMFIACGALPGESAVIITGSPSAITDSIMKVSSILIKHPVPNNNPSVQNQSTSSESSTATSGQSSSPSSQGSGIGSSQLNHVPGLLHPLEYSFQGQSSSPSSQGSGIGSSQLNRVLERLHTIHVPTLTINRSEQSVPSTSSSRTPVVLPSAQATSSGCAVDCDEFGKYVAKELKKMNPSCQSQLRKEILSLITSTRFQMTKKDHLSDATSEECTICLEVITDKAFAESCLHSFCYECILQWVKQKQSCPICVGQISSIIHNVRSNDDYDIQEVNWGLTSRNTDSDDDSSDDQVFVIL